MGVENECFEKDGILEDAVENIVIQFGGKQDDNDYEQQSEENMMDSQITLQPMACQQ